jgi:phosphohistidine swiveling domain-containing protein
MSWIRLGERKGDFLKNCLLYEGITEHFRAVFGREHCIFITLRDADTFTHYVDEESSRELSEFVSQRVAENPDFLKNLFEKGKQHFQKLIFFAEHAGRQKNNFKELMKKYFQLYRMSYPHFLITLFADTVGKNHVIPMADFRFFSRASFNKTHENIKPCLEEIAKQHAVTVDELKFLTPAEILLLLDNIPVNIQQKISQRQQCYFMFQKGSFELKENATYNVNEHFSQILKGIGTSPFIYTGKVKIITSTADAEKIEQGDVIVTRMTTPDIVSPFFQKAGALVTDEGGITCHAAVISREFNIPALMGTGNATRLLKDGDIVEVDAEKGIVRKIS